MNEFGKSLRYFRNRCNDPENSGRRLSQEQLGELLGRELGFQGSFSGAAVSDWERGKSRIRADDRLALVSLLAVLRKQGGVQAVSDANELLEAGNYRALNQAEIEKIFPETLDQPGSPTQHKRHESFTPFTSGNIFSLPNDELRTLVTNAKEGPEPAWPRIFVALLRPLMDRWSVFGALKVLLWIWVWLMAWGLLSPSLQWPFSGREDAVLAVTLYAAGSLIIPAFSGALTATKSDPFWQQQRLAEAAVTRLYTYQGAFIGFHLGYFAAFVFGLLKYFTRQPPSTWFDMTVMLFPLIVGYMGARLVPYNLWRAYNRLVLRDGMVFFFFIGLGPLWSLFFLDAYPTLLTPVSGAGIILTAVTALVALMAWQFRRKGTTVIPHSWWLAFWGLVLACQVAVILLGKW